MLGIFILIRKTQTDSNDLNENFRSLLERTQVHAVDFLNKLDSQSVGATTDTDTLRRRLGLPLGNDGIPAERVIDELVAATEGGHLGSAGGVFLHG